MKLSELLSTLKDEDILKRVFELYPDQKKNKEGYIAALKELRGIESTNTRMIIVVEEVTDEEGEKYTHVSGKKRMNDPAWYALEFSDWKEWLGMRIDEASRKIGDLSVMAHCLWEITWRGYSNDEVKEEASELIDRVKEIMEEENAN